MKIKHGDLFAYAERTQGPIIVHGCNCRGAFAAGFAGLIRNRYPRAYEAYINDHDKALLVPGFVRYVPIDNVNNTIIANACTQYNPGADATLCSIDACVDHLINDLSAVAAIMHRKQRRDWDQHVFLPAIGCGIGGLDLKDVQPILERLDVLEEVGYTINLVLYEG